MKISLCNIYLVLLIMLLYFFTKSSKEHMLRSMMLLKNRLEEHGAVGLVQALSAHPQLCPFCLKLVSNCTHPWQVVAEVYNPVCLISPFRRRSREEKVLNIMISCILMFH